MLLSEVFNVLSCFLLDDERSHIRRPVKSIFYLAMPLNFPQQVSQVLNTFSPAILGKWKVGYCRECGPPLITLLPQDSIVTRRKTWPQVVAQSRSSQSRKGGAKWMTLEKRGDKPPFLQI